MICCGCARFSKRDIIKIIEIVLFIGIALVLDYSFLRGLKTEEHWSVILQDVGRIGIDFHWSGMNSWFICNYNLKLIEMDSGFVWYDIKLNNIIALIKVCMEFASLKWIFRIWILTVVTNLKFSLFSEIRILTVFRNLNFWM
jgi:hypothetical protein